MELDVELMSGRGGSDKIQQYSSPHCHSDVINSPSNNMIPSIELKLFDGAVCTQVDDTPAASSCDSGEGDLGALLEVADRRSVVHQLDNSTEVEEDECGSTTTTMWGCHHCGLAMSGTEQQLHDHVSQCGLTQTVIHHGDDGGDEEEDPHHLVTTAFDGETHQGHGTLSTDHFTSTMLIGEDCDDASGLPQQPNVLCCSEEYSGAIHEIHPEDEDVSSTKKSFVHSSDVRLVARYWKCSVCGVAMQQGLADHLDGHSKEELIGALLALAEPVYHAADEVFLATTTQDEAQSPKSLDDDHDDVIPIFKSSTTRNSLTEFSSEQNSVSLTSCLETSTHQHILTLSPPRSGKESSDVWKKKTRNVVREVGANGDNMHKELSSRGIQVVKEICNYSKNDHLSASTKTSSPQKSVHKKFSIVNNNHLNVTSAKGVQRQHQGEEGGIPNTTLDQGAPHPATRGVRGRRRNALIRSSGVQRQWSSRTPHPCPVCGKVLSSRGNVAKHITTHSASKPWNCLSCGVGFNSQRDKQHHDQQYHSGGERGHECPVCGKSFAVRDNLREHLLFHDRKDKTCDICGKMFWTQKCVTRHRKRHFPDKKHRCEMCPKTFAVKWDCTLHARKVHGVT